uniref:LysM and putative peptidoglycan-binding domain-containing protein 2 n=1 Tax=Lygus hesperus TaxID=30085 RepID=A0A0A9WVW5_LYGHE
MNDINMEERIAIRDSARSLKKNYGSTANNSKRYESFIKHKVSETDTLQGLALKYGVTTEQIRRANRLWANDSIFLRKSLFIPVTGDNVTSPSDVVLLEADDGPTTSHNNNNHHEKREDDDSYNDFLVKIDCAIASTKTQVMVAQDNSEFVDTDSIFWRRKGAMSRLKQQQQQQATSNGTEVPTVMTQGRKVRNSLQRLEKEQDEIFEL